jgi:hypothetical protein
MVLPSTSISPVAMAGLIVASLRARTRPVTLSTYSLRTRSAVEMLSVSGSKDHLHDPLAIAQVEKDHAAVIAAAVHPAAERDRLLDVALRSSPQ